MPQILILAEHDSGQLKLATKAAVSCAQNLCAAAGGAFDILVLGDGIAPVAETLRGFGAAQVLTADHEALRQPLADRYAQVIAAAVRERGATMLLAAASSFSKDILPRTAALLDAGMLSDVTAVWPEEGGLVFKRVLFAGNAFATMTLDGPVQVITVRPAAFAAPKPAQTLSPVAIVPVDAAALPAFMEFVSREEKKTGRPDATEARIVVSGGRALKNAEEFERIVGGLADVLGAGVGSSRALVDAGITANTLQIGQTGKVVAPELYIALGLSGAIQHLAGMKDTKIIAAINSDPDAPIFEVADYGLVADLHEAVPELISRLQQKP